jgi:hypothetical protein
MNREDVYFWIVDILGEDVWDVSDEQIDEWADDMMCIF